MPVPASSAKHDFGERQHDHHGEREARQRVLERIEDAGQGRVGAPRVDRNSAAHLAIGRAFR